MCFQQIGSLPRLAEALDSADDSEMARASEFARTFIRGIAVFSQIADAFAGHRNASGLAAAEVLQADPGVRVIFIAWFIPAMRLESFANNLQDVVASLTGTVLPVQTQAQQLAALPQAETPGTLVVDQRRLLRVLEP
jgi:hypothetical protein